MIVVLTYERPHRKTQDLLMRLNGMGEDVQVVATPWVERKVRAPLLPFRPGDPGFPMAALLVSNERFTNGLGYPYQVTEALYATLNELDPEAVLIGGAGILSPEIVQRFACINIHPGFLPYGRGLDSFKWALLSEWPVGITAHVVDENPDCGNLLFQQEVSIVPYDTFHSVALRMYEAEMNAFIPALRKFRQIGRTGMKLESSLPAFRRMKPGDEKATLAAFEARERKIREG